MTTGEAKVRVRLDTSKAKTELSGLVKDAGGAAKAIGHGISSALGSGVRSLGLGAAFGAGVSAVTSPTSSGIMSVIGEAAGGFGAALEHWALGDLVPEARASAQAREEMIAAFGTVAGHTDKIPPGAKAFYDQTNTLLFEREKGRAMFERDEQFRGPGFAEIAEKAIDRITSAISDGFRALGDFLTSPSRWL